MYTIIEITNNFIDHINILQRGTIIEWHKLYKLYNHYATLMDEIKYLFASKK